MINYKYIAIEGNIGVGKTSLAKLLAKKISCALVLEEFKKNHFLPLFYQNQKKYTLPLEITFLIDRYQQLNLHPFSIDVDNYIVSDYLFEKSKIFSKNNLQNEDYKVFFKLFKTLNASTIQPDLVIFLENSLVNIKKNILKRGRAFEKNISLEYLEQIGSSYMNFLKTSKKYKILQINLDGIDFVKNESDFQMIFDLLKRDFPIGRTLINY